MRFSCCVLALLMTVPLQEQRASASGRGGIQEPTSKKQQDGKRTDQSLPARVGRKTVWPAPVRLMSVAEAQRYLVEAVAPREAAAQRAGIMYDGETGLTYDGVNFNRRTGALNGPRDHSAASKESLDISLLVKAIQGDRIAQTMVSPDPKNPRAAVAVALDRLERKIASFRDFNARHPGFGGFLPWFKIVGKPGLSAADRNHRRMEPTTNWQSWDKLVPGLDNGQLAWSIYHAAGTLRKLGYRNLAQKYQDHFDLMRRNVVRMFYDPNVRELRAETELGAGSRTAPEKNNYMTHGGGHLNDPYEGKLFIMFASLFGDWRDHPDGLAAISSPARSKPLEHRTRRGKRITVVSAWKTSSHEQWGEMVLPFVDDPLARDLATNLERARTNHFADYQLPGMRASAADPRHHDRYVSGLGIRSIAGFPDEMRATIFAPYAAFPTMLVDKAVGTTWLRNMLEGPGVMGRYGMVESFDHLGRHAAPLKTWDGSVTVMLAAMGGIRDDIRTLLRQDKLYARFRELVRADLGNFVGRPLRGTNVSLRPPTVGVPRPHVDSTRNTRRGSNRQR